MSLTTSLYEYWNLDETTGDRIGLVNATHLVPFSAQSATAGIYGNAAVFTGAHVLQKTSPNNSLGPQNAGWTLSVWFKGTSTDSFQRTIVSKGSGVSPNIEFQLYWTGSSRQVTLTIKGSATHTVQTSGVALPNLWHHAIAWVTPTTGATNLTVDGVDYTTTSSNTLTPNAANTFAVGGNTTSNTWEGYIDEVAVWTRTLDPDERLALWNNGAGKFYPFTATGYQKLTITTLRGLVKERIGGEGVFWNDTEIDGALNEALAIWQLLTGDSVVSYAQVVNQGAEVVTLDTTATPPLQLVRIRRSTGTGSTQTLGSALYPITVYELDQGFYGRQGASSGTPSWWAPLGTDKFVLYPKASSTSYYGVQYYSGDPRIATSGTAFFDMGDEEVVRIVEYAQWVLAFKEGLQEAIVNVDPLKELFLAAARLRNERLRNTAPYRDYMAPARDEAEPARDVKEQKGLRK